MYSNLPGYSTLEQLAAWTCPSCGRGVAPGNTTCDHGNTPTYAPLPFNPFQSHTVPVQMSGCGSCMYGRSACGCALYTQTAWGGAGVR